MTIVEILRRLARFAKRSEVTFVLSVVAFATSAWPYLVTVVPRPSVALVVSDAGLRLASSYSGVVIGPGEIDCTLTFVNNGNRDVLVHGLQMSLGTAAADSPDESLYIASLGSRPPPIVLKPAEIRTVEIRAAVTTPATALSGKVTMVDVSSVDTKGNEYRFRHPILMVKSASSSQPELVVQHRFLPNIVANKTVRE